MLAGLGPSNEEIPNPLRASGKSTGSSVKIDQAKGVIRKNSVQDQNLAGLTRQHPSQLAGSVEVGAGLAIVDEAEAE